MRKLLLTMLGIIWTAQLSLATPCSGAITIPGSPTFPYTQSLVCGSTNDINSSNASSCSSSSSYLGGNESVYTWTPTYDYINASIAYSGQTWSAIFVYNGCPTAGGTCVGSTAGSASSKTLNVASFTAGQTYYFVFDTWPTPISPCSGTFTLNASIAPPPAPATPVQLAATTSCIAGTQLDVTATPPANVSWYWQTTSTGTSQTVPYSGPYTVLANGTYYLRAYNNVTSTWSNSSSSCVVSDFPTASAPPAPVAALNPSCAPLGSSLTMASAPTGVEYYWQGSNLNGTSTATPATTPFAYTTSGTYHVSAFEAATGCWSNTTPITVVVDTYIPSAPTVSINNLNVCSGTNEALISADVPAITSQTCSATNSASGTDASNPTATISSAACNLAPIASALLTGTITYYGTPGYCATYGWFSFDILIDGVEVASNQCDLTNYDLSAYLPFTTVAIRAQDDDAYADQITISLSVQFTYAQPEHNLAWYDAASSGNVVGNVSPLNAVGTSLMAAPAQLGVYEFYAATISGGCESATRTLVTVNVADVNAELTPVAASCNGNNNGSFTLASAQCGTQPFTYSVDGGAYGAIPTDLVAGTYSVIIQDATGLLSAPISVVVTQPASPSNVTFSNITYFTADVAWATTGDETSWTVEFGPEGFTPGTGTTLTATDTSITLTGLTADTDYDVYVTPLCGANPESTGPISFATNPGFFTWNNACGPGFIDIATTGTNLNLGDDQGTTIDMPIDFTYQNSEINSLYVSNNGGVELGAATESYFYWDAISNMSFGTLSAWGDDLDSETGDVLYATVGTAPNQVFIVQWNNSNNYPNGSGTVTFQMQFHESTNEIFFVYNDVIFDPNSNDNYAGNAIIAAAGDVDILISDGSQNYLQNNSCVHFYNALCPDPVNVAVTTFQEELMIEWQAGPYGETEWTLIYGPEGFDPATGGTTIANLTSAEAAISGLDQLTTYDIYIYSECALDDLTSGGYFVSATTLPWCNTPTNLSGTTAVDTMMLNWSWVEVTGAQNALSGFNVHYGDYNGGLYNGTIVAADGINFADTVSNSAFLAGGVYEVYVQAVCGVDTSNYVGPFTLVMPLTNDTICGAEMLSVDGTVYYFNNVGATTSAGEVGIMPTGTDPDGYNNSILPQLTWGATELNGTTWFTFVAPPSGSMWFSGNDQNFFASQIAIYEATDCNDLASFELVAASDQVDAGFFNHIAPHFTVCGLTPGQTYYIMHDAWSTWWAGPTFGQYSIKMTPIVLEAGVVAEEVNVCTGSSVDLFSGIAGNDLGGVWTAVNAAANTGIDQSTFNSEGLAYNLFDFEYRITEGCAYDSVMTQVQVWNYAMAGEDGTFTVCKNEPFNLVSGMSGTVDLNGIWYDPSNVELAGSVDTASNIPGNFNYDYVVSNGICPADTATVLVVVDGSCDFTAGIETLAGSFEVYPNPTSSTVYVNNGLGLALDKIELIDMSGRVVLAVNKGSFSNELAELNVSNLTTGVYTVKLIAGQQTFNQRLIKQ